MPTFKDYGMVGQIVHSMMNEAQMQQYYGPGWIYCDGRSVAGSLYETLIGNSSVPSLAGRYVRARDFGVGNDPNGDSVAGTVRTSHNQSHSHTVNDPGHSHVYLKAISTAGGEGGTGTGSYSNTSTADSGTGITLSNSGSTDVQVDSIVFNAFIKIN